MVNTLRRFSTPIMWVITILVIVSFVFWGGNRNDSGRGRSTAAMLYGKPVSMETWQHQARRLAIFARMGSEVFAVLDPMSRNGEPTAVGVGNLFVFDREANALGITVTDEEINKQLVENTSFHDADGKFDGQLCQRFIDNFLTPQGYNKEQIQQFLADEVRINKMRDIIGSTVAATPAQVNDYIQQQHTNTEASYVAFKHADFRKEQKATDEELKKSFEEKKELLKTPELRKVRFAAFLMPPAPDGKPLDAKARTEQLQPLVQKAYDLRQELAEPNANFEQLATKAGATLGETKEFFGAENPPAEIETSPTVAEAAFQLTKEKPYSNHLTLQKGAYVLMLADTKAPEQQTFETAKAQLETELLDAKADEAARKKATEMQAKIAEAQTAGKSFYQAAEALGLKAEPLSLFSANVRPMGKNEYADVIMQAASNLAPGKVSDVINSDKDALIVNVDRRFTFDAETLNTDNAKIAAEIEDDSDGSADLPPQYRAQLRRQLLRMGLKSRTFRIWLSDRSMAAGVGDLVKSR